MNNNNCIIEVRELTKKFGDFVAVDKISFNIRKGEIIGFIGANGAGKTTAIRMLCGLLKPTSGDAMIAGFDIYKETEKIKRNIGYMSQKFSLYDDLTIDENIRFYAGIYGLSKLEIRNKAERLIKKLNLDKEKRSLLKSIPLGWKQKISFSIALIHNPSIVFLDEPTAGVDPITRRQFWEMIYESANSGTTIIVTTHYMDEAEYCDRVMIMAQGKISAIGMPKELKNQFNALTMDEVFVSVARGGTK
jgi:ABC-2 type transport system ATP-binding protein